MASTVSQPKAIAFQQYTGPPAPKPRKAFRLPAARLKRNDCINSPAPAVDEACRNEDVLISDGGRDRGQTDADNRESGPAEGEPQITRRRFSNI